MQLVASIAKQRKVGARALRSIIEDLLIKDMFELPGSKKRSLKITCADVQHYIDHHIPNSERKKLLSLIDN